MPIIRSVSVKVILAVLVSVAITLIVGFSISFKIEHDEFTSVMMKETDQVAATVLASLDRTMRENDNKQTLELMKTLSSTNGVEHLMVISPRAMIALSSRPEEQGSTLAIPGGTCTLCHEVKGPRLATTVLTLKKPDGEDVFRHLTPILNKAECRTCHQNRFLGLLVADLRTTNLKRHEAAVLKRFVFIALAIFSVITLCILGVVTVLVRRPIRFLIQGTKEMARGNYDFRIPVTSRDEMGVLARSFNQMAAKVDHSRSILEKWNVNLEEEVDRRTDELKRSNSQLEEEKQKTESVVHSIAEGVLSVDNEGVLVLANPQVAEIFGREEAALLGQPLRELLKFSAGRFRNFEEIEEFMLLPDSASTEKVGEIQQIQPRPRTFKVSRSPIVGRRGENRGWAFSFHDMTREKEIDEIKTNLVAMVSHELRTPLTAIKGSLALLTDGKLENQAEYEEFQHIALANTNRLIELINNLLDLSKIESGSVFYEHGTFYLRALLERCVDTLSGYARRNGVELRLEVAPEITEVSGDATKMEQVIINLLSNAVKFSPGGGEIKVSAALVGDEYVVSVVDHGLGIPSEEMEKIFEKFYQVDMTPVRRIGGSGLGLAICKAIVEGHGGRIWVESALGEGSTFSFSLPRLRTRKNLELPLARRSVAVGEKIPYRVLIVEDEVSVRKVLTRYLEEKGFEVLQAASAKEALELARLSRPDCITVDVMLPDLDGFDLTAVLKSDPKTSRIPIVFITVVEGEGKARGFHLGAAAYFTKPVQYERVADKIETLLGGLGLNNKGPNILMVDDEPDVIKPLGVYLERRGYGIRYAHSGGEALDAIHQAAPDVVVLDLMMPVMSGYELIRRLKNDPRYASLPIIVLTASEGGKSRGEVLNMGAAAFFQKPIYPELLWQEIEKIIH